MIHHRPQHRPAKEEMKKDQGVIQLPTRRVSIVWASRVLLGPFFLLCGKSVNHIATEFASPTVFSLSLSEGKKKRRKNILKGLLTGRRGRFVRPFFFCPRRRNPRLKTGHVFGSVTTCCGGRSQNGSPPNWPSLSFLQTQKTNHPRWSFLYKVKQISIGRHLRSVCDGVESARCSFWCGGD